MKRYVSSKWTKKISFVLLLLVALFLHQTPAVAEDQSLAGATGFTYSITFPENQKDKELGYYSLKMTAGQEQKISIALSNPSNEKVTIDVAVNGAKTNQNGVIEYGESTIENDPSLPFDFKDIVTAPKTVDLAPGETKNLDLTIKMPETSFDGVIAGGIQLMRSGQDKDASNSSGSKVINQYAYVIGVVLQENDTEVLADLKLNDVTPGQSNYRNAIFINYSNIKPAYLNDMTVEVQVTEKGKQAVLYERKQTAMRMAPNSFINFPVSMNGEKMVAGDYVADILVTSGDQKWHWTKEFKITDQDANKFNERDVGLVQEKGLDWKLIVFIVLGIVLLILIIFFILRLIGNKKKKKEQDEKRVKQMKKRQAGNVQNNRNKRPKN